MGARRRCAGRGTRAAASGRNATTSSKPLIRTRETAVDKASVGRVEGVAKKRGISMACIATAWSISKGCSPIIALGSKQRVEEAVFNAGFPLSDEDAEYLEEPYQPKTTQGYRERGGEMGG